MDPEPAKKKRRRIHLNCEECRRTKSKCNRSWPCSECVKKGLAHICPNHVSKVSQPKSQTIAELQARVKQLEAVIARHGLEADSIASDGDDEQPITGRNNTLPGPGAPQSAVDMAAMLGHLTLGNGGSSSKRFAGMGTTAFFLASPGESEGTSDDEEDEGVRREAMREELAPPWGRSRGVSLTGRGHLPGVLLDRCRAMLPSRRAAKEMFDRFFEATSWRIQPMTPAFFDTVLSSVYDSPEGAHAHDLAVLFAMQAMAMLFDATAGTQSAFQSVDYHQTAYSCLVAGNFYTETTLSSLVSLHLLGSFLINSDDKRLPDGIFAIVGLGVRLATIAGYHREPAPGSMGQDELDWRRRVWHELLALERVHCLTALLPGSIAPRHYDTAFPSDAHKEGYFFTKWKLGLHMQRVFDYWSTIEIADYQEVQDIDAGLRRFLHDLPPHLRCASFPAESFPLARPGAPAVVVSPAPVATVATSTSDYTSTITPERLAHQQYRMATHICMVFFYLHRPCFMRALSIGGHIGELSVRTVVEVCERMLELVRGILSSDHSMSRWFSFAADLFSVLLCQTLLVVKTTDAALAQARFGVLAQGLAVLEWTATASPNSKNRALVGRTRRLVAKAKESLARFPSINAETTAAGITPAVKTEVIDVDLLELQAPPLLYPSLPHPALPVPDHSPSDASSGAAAAPFTAFELPEGSLGFSMPTTNDAQFDMWLAMLFPSGGGGEAHPAVVPNGQASDDLFLDPAVPNGEQAEELFLDPTAWQA
ncbi:putative transcriptional regulatory protein [Vanrija pseudolonga]|uniref:Purtative transcriptional regulatory protein n=1 Tax=Vanrija pseudolonga TaxID=143232 RepID=A0AAF0YM74_9TREE|nr:purtative transcriptional regulatory protein [Vanrija pseudolonga]